MDRRCDECGGAMHDDATVCPHCGHTPPQPNTCVVMLVMLASKIALLLIVAIVLFVFLVNCGAPGGQ